MNNIIVKLLYNYLNLKDLSTLRPTCQEVCALIDRDFEMLFQRELDKLGPHNDINVLLSIVFHKRELLIRVLQRIKNATGFVLENSGMFLYAQMIIYYPDDDEIEAYFQLKHMPKMDNKVASAYHMDLQAFKKAYRANTFSISWNLILTEYIHGIFHRATKDFQINWELVSGWNQTPFFKFIKGALNKSDYAFILGGISKLSKETQRRNAVQIQEFAKEIFNPMIDGEIQLLTDIQEGNEVSLAGYTVELNNRMPEIRGARDAHAVSTFHKLKFVVTGSLIRAVTASAALISYDLFMYFWEIANRVFDFSDDEYIDVIRLNSIASREHKISEIINPIQYVSVDMISLMAYYKKLIPLECFKADESQKIKMQLLRGEECDVYINGPITPLIQETPIPVPVCSMPWMSLKQCKRLRKKLEWEQIPYFYDVFLTRDLDFWIDFVTSHMETFKNDADLKERFLAYHITLNNVDFVKYALEAGMLNEGLRHGIVSGWLNDLIDEYNEAHPVEEEPEDYTYSGRMF